MAKKKPFEPLEAVGDYPTQETKSRHSLDMRLRKNGFRIHSRPGDKEPIWELGGKLYTEGEALVLLEQ